MSRKTEKARSSSKGYRAKWVCAVLIALELSTIVLFQHQFKVLMSYQLLLAVGPSPTYLPLCLASSFLPMPKLQSLTAIQCLTQSLILKFNSKFLSVKLIPPPHHLPPPPPSPSSHRQVKDVIWRQAEAVSSCSIIYNLGHAHSDTARLSRLLLTCHAALTNHAGSRTGSGTEASAVG